MGVRDRGLVLVDARLGVGEVLLLLGLLLLELRLLLGELLAELLHVLDGGRLGIRDLVHVVDAADEVFGTRRAEDEVEGARGTGLVGAAHVVAQLRALLVEVCLGGRDLILGVHDLGLGVFEGLLGSREVVLHGREVVAHVLELRASLVELGLQVSARGRGKCGVWEKAEPGRRRCGTEQE